ncbi:MULTISPECIES: helix-turn-helix domain-containing protein [Romboutsia]|uniref:Cro/C1-type HTH domain profile n=1 Tax=Romboutsia hominis TaxID=1507512 RepID=A0A2P2BRH8_9FIRM|nr:MULTISPECIES: helix-turn-helix domain-containing protein [Romboutsia]MDB8805049.1 helix-turn-helix domain-containing protein [Romboutsia sp. 1001216sp1]MDB8808039.1 helix-turn-helix domain-containing protein [Romboutsia sp. 1001216sp1]MDB8810694.1 helix-turn-helix domain-containing protein [Romboutsia sp. 1001216sp1]MDB8816414.1 helix-turn-helix domain-containing protein [Romboutsia sp. 1001216sp1]MDB8818633.1 helix-turn-helix domain-containing protein [Romboutsia sp. 1001216sp1]
MTFIEDKLIFANRLRQEREKLGLMQKEMAQKLDIPSNTYNGYETGKRSPNLEVAKHISDVLDVSVDYLLGRTDERNLNKEKPKLDKGIKTIAAHKVNINEDLPDEAIEKINDYIKMVEMMYKNKDK